MLRGTVGIRCRRTPLLSSESNGTSRTPGPAAAETFPRLCWPSSGREASRPPAPHSLAAFDPRVAGVRPNKQMQPTGRTIPSSARALIAGGDQWNEELCGRHHEGLQLICSPLDSANQPRYLSVMTLASR
jgi:hypothetical protein